MYAIKPTKPVSAGGRYEVEGMQYYSKLSDEELLVALACFKAWAAACRIKYFSDDKASKVFAEKSRKAIDENDEQAWLESRREFFTQRKAVARFHHLCVRELNLIAKEIGNRLGPKRFSHPFIKLLHEDPSWEKDFLSTPVMRGPGKRRVALRKVLKSGLEFFDEAEIR